MSSKRRAPTSPRAQSGIQAGWSRRWGCTFWITGARFRLRLHLFIAVFAVVVAGVTVYSLIVTPIYRAKSRLLIEPSSVKLTRSEAFTIPPRGPAISKHAAISCMTQMELICSDHLMAKAFTQFEFATKEEFLRTVEPMSVPQAGLGHAHP